MAVLKANGSFLKANGKILVKPEGGGDFVVIGGRAYPTTKIGNQIWLAENLDYKFAGCGIGGSTSHQSTPHAWYYGNDEATYGVSGYKCGLLYNIAAVNYIEQNKSLLLPEGWHIPSAEEWNTLISNVGGSAIGSPKLRSVSVPYAPSWNGTDDYGFSASPTGSIYSSDHNFHDISVWANYWTNSITYIADMSMNKTLGVTYFNVDAPIAIRLVKDA